MKYLLIIYILLICQLFSCNIPNVSIDHSIDPDIVLINIEDRDRIFIAKLLLGIDTCDPGVVGVIAKFLDDRGEANDSLLQKAFLTIQNDALIFNIDSDGEFIHSHSKFTDYIAEEGFVSYYQTFDVVDRTLPILYSEEKGSLESFALKVINIWKKDFKHKLKPNKSVSLRFNRQLQQFTVIQGSDILAENFCDLIKDKIVLVGYLGPTNEDKLFTPFRFLVKYAEDEPDTYATVIIANEIRTLLNYEKK